MDIDVDVAGHTAVPTVARYGSRRVNSERREDDAT
jgi:hypothetical protein